MRLAHTTSLYDPGNTDTRRRMSVARQTWEQVYRESAGTIVARHQVISHARRTSADIGDDRRLPFVKDLIEFGLRESTAEASDAVMITNADTCLIPSRMHLILQSIQDGGCYYSCRYEHRRFHLPLPESAAAEAPIFSGADLFAFTSQWWEERRDGYPDLLLGAEAWDGVLKLIIEAGGFNPGIPVVYHEAHPAYWRQQLLSSPSQIHNRKLARLWIERHDVPDFLCHSTAWRSGRR